MKKLMTKEEVAEFKKRWARVNNAERKELREATLYEKIFQLIALISSAKVFKVSGVLTAENNKVRNNWNRLREAYANGR